MTTQIKPIGSGSFQNVNKKDKTSVDKSNAPSSLTTLPTGQKLQSIYALNLWIITAGAGSASVTASEILKASGLLVQEV